MLRFAQHAECPAYYWEAPRHASFSRPGVACAGRPAGAARRGAAVPWQPHVIGRYELREELGAGGFATVYRAYDATLDREVALKVLHSHLARDTAIRERFVREGRALARVRHANVVIVYEGGEADGAAYLAMELVEGRSLEDLLTEHGPLPIGEVLELTEQVAGALEAVHARDLIHRDVKPANVLLEDGSGRAVLLDLGVARDLASVTMSAGRIFGTPGFMAPEQVHVGGRVTPRTDVYQLAATVYTLLAGRPPFEGDTLQVLDAVKHDPPPDLERLRPDLPSRMVAVVADALAKDPGRRPQGAREFATRLRTAAGLGPTLPLPAPAGRPAPALPAGAPPPTGAAPAEKAPALRGGDTIRERAAAPLGEIPSRPPQGSGRWASPSLAARRRRRYVAGAVAAVLLLMAGIAALVAARAGGRDHDEQAVAETGTPAPPTPCPVRPVVFDLNVGSSSVVGSEHQFVVEDRVTACFNLTPGNEGLPLVVVAAARSEPPRSADEAAVVARSGPISQRVTGRQCHTLRVLQPPLPAGIYWVSVLYGSHRLNYRVFVAKPRPEDVLLSDDFEDPDNVKLLRYTDLAGRREVDGGEYVIFKSDPTRTPTVSVPGAVGDDAALAVDARLAGDTAGRSLLVGCRASSTGAYQLVLDPTNGTFSLFHGGARSTELVSPRPSNAIARGNAVNRVELSCVGSTISVTINGTQVVSLQDSTLKAGGFWIGVAAPTTAEARFDNLLVVKR